MLFQRWRELCFLGPVLFLLTSFWPSYNYSTVQLQGFISINNDESFVRDAIAQLSKQEEEKHVPNDPWDPTEESVQPRLAHIVGF